MLYLLHPCSRAHARYLRPVGDAVMGQKMNTRLFCNPEPPDDPTNQQQAQKIDPDHDGRSSLGNVDTVVGLNQRSRLALLTTVTDEAAIAAPATIGLSKIPSRGKRIPAATGIPRLL